jgi:hypothetical protein
MCAFNGFAVYQRLNLLRFALIRYRCQRSSNLVGVA